MTVRPWRGRQVIERQAMRGKKGRPTSWFVIDEAVLYRPHGGKEVMREQLLSLEAQADAPNTVVQIMPFSAVRHRPQKLLIPWSFGE